MKMKNIKRFISILLCAAMLLSVVMLSACDKNTNDNGNGGNDDRNTESGVTVQAVRLKNSLEKGEIISAKDIEVVDEKDYIRHAKPNGYRSLHLIVGVPIFLAHEKRIMKVEIQLRTIAMDFWASLEHQLRYKKDYTTKNDMAEELLICAQLSAELDERMEKLRKIVRPIPENDDTINII